jgi:crossover junction endodeoxyribonuclease RuvC
VPTVLGIDPGSKATCFGLVAKEGDRLRLVAVGRITAKTGAPLAERLKQVYEGLREILGRHTPDCAAIEDIFYAKNIKSAVRLGHVRGVALLAAAEAGLKVFEYPPASIKVAVVGYGRADKAQVGLMVRNLLGLRQDLTEDETDALAAAICHLHQTPALTGNNK